jgi:hypothetical protein
VPFMELKVHCHLYKSFSQDPFLSHMIPVHMLTPYSFKICFNIILQSCPALPSSLFLPDFLIKFVQAFLKPAIPTAFAAHLILLCLVTLMMFCEELKLPKIIMECKPKGKRCLGRLTKRWGDQNMELQQA